MQRLEDDGGVVGEALGGVARRPAAGVLEHLGQVPVVERDDRLDAGCEELVDEASVEVQARLVDGARARRQDARPGDAEAIGRQAQSSA